jgi:hypothetical protein
MKPIEIEIKDLPEVREAFDELGSRFDRLQRAAATAYVAWASKAVKAPETRDAMSALRDILRDG